MILSLVSQRHCGSAPHPAGRRMWVRASGWRWLATLACVAVSLSGSAVAPAAAQTTASSAGSGASYITPFPPGDIYKLQLYGDNNFGEDLLQSIGELAGATEQIDAGRKPRLFGTLTRSEYEDDIRSEEQARDVVHIGVVMLGLNDRNAIRVQGSKSLAFGSAAWKDQYGQRLDRLFKVLKRRNIALYIVSLPPLRRGEANSEAALVNETLLERSQANGLRFIDVAESFSDETGAFTQFGLDAAGNRNKLRDADGVGFTQAGFRKLASLVIAEIKRDLAAARAERSVPLAGGESEQKRINPDKAAATPQATAAKATVGIAEPRGTARAPVTATAAASTAAGGAPSGQDPAATANQTGLKADTSRLVLRFQSIAGRDETAQQAEIVRPLVPAAVIALLTRKETVEAGQQAYDLLLDDIGNGVSVTTMVTATPDGPAATGRRRGPTALAAYSAVWVKGERLEAKPGRADDFFWPRRDVFLTVEPPPAATLPPKPNTPQARRR